MLAVTLAFMLALDLAPARASGDMEPGDVELGAWLAGACVSCHQPGAASGGVPTIAGLPQAAFVAAMEEYRSGARPSPLMHALASGLSDAEIAALAAYFEDVKPAR
ncbi:c-type cytochrome [Xanthobacter versatilis]|uniref:c-type cytochrome n=1 Tax=Xanthobacter autotrophicus (strain ATCC BAA-1158 / Py2) TaxID=78245 RepID=UPI00372863AF